MDLGGLAVNLCGLPWSDRFFPPWHLPILKTLRRLRPYLVLIQIMDTGKDHTEDSASIFDGHHIIYLDSSTGVPDWQALGVALVVDCSGNATRREGAQTHLDTGAKYVLVSAPSKSLADCEGINLESFNPGKDHIISMGSCTTNALAAPIKVIREAFGIEYGLFSTVHSYTNSQSLTDQPMSDLRDCWAAAENMIPSSSGAAKALQFIWPDLNVSGKAYRIPTRTGSIAELNLITTKQCSVQEVNEAFRTASLQGELVGVMDVLDEQWISARIFADMHSALIDLPLTAKQGELLSVASWYDNEWGLVIGSPKLRPISPRTFRRIASLKSYPPQSITMQ
nr:type I glyceraldehyde-3-phosphate dehydrogenase [Pedobacter sp. Leaf41]